MNAEMKPTREKAPVVLSPNAERFRMRLIRDFRLLENLNEMEQGLEAPKYHPPDVQDPKKLKKIIADNPYALVKFSPITKSKGIFTKQERRWRRIKCRETKYPPLDLWANWVVESNWFQNVMLVLIISNAILLVLDADISEAQDESSKIWIRIIRTCDYCCLMVFIVEILLKWVDDFKSFWRNGWNQLDFYVTVISVLPELLKLFDTDLGSDASWFVTTLGFLRVLRITRLLKMVSRFEQARIILLAVTKAFSAMSFILLLLGLFMWIFAMMGGVLFQRYTLFDSRAAGIELTYQTAFSDTMWAFATLFQLMTLDHWLDTLMDLLKVMTNPYESTLTVIYIMSWIWIGSFVFKNIFAGIMVNNFQAIRNDLHWEQKEKEAKNEVDKFKKEFQGIANNAAASEAHFEDSRECFRTRAKPSEDSIAEVGQQLLAVPTNTTRGQEHATGQLGDPLITALLRKKSVVSVMSRMSTNTNFTIQELASATTIGHESEEAIFNAQWDSLVQCHLDASHEVPKESVWPRDALFKFYYLMENLQDNLQERQGLLKLASTALLQIHDQ